MDTVTQVQILSVALRVSFPIPALGKDLNPSVPLLHSSMSKQLGILGSLALVRQLREGKLWIQPSLTPLKKWLCVTSCLWQRGLINTHNYISIFIESKSLDSNSYPSPEKKKENFPFFLSSFPSPGRPISAIFFFFNHLRRLK